MLSIARGQLYLGLLTLLLVTSKVNAMPVVFSATDSGTASAASEAAFVDWSNAVGSFTLDNLDGLGGNPGFGGDLTSALGNHFSSSDDLVRVSTFSFAVLQGVSLGLTQIGGITDFVWDVAAPIDAFGFFARNNDGGTVTINYMNGQSHTQTLTAASSNSTGDNLFWGISDLAGAVSRVTITSSDPGNGNSFWDRFVYRSVQVPEPATALLAGMGLLFLRRFGLKHKS